MNIFASSPDPRVSAMVLDDKRVVKMVLETCQLLCTAINENGGVSPYKSTHKNHPCAVWARASKANYEWLLNHFDCLFLEYTRRYHKIHKCEQYYNELVSGIAYIPDGPFTNPPNCTIFKDISNVYEAYEKYLEHKWANDKRTPTWFQEAR